MDLKDAYLSKPWLKHYPGDVAHEVEIPDVSVPEFFDRMAAKHAGKTALVFYGRSIKYAELKDLTDRFAAALADIGVSKGDTVSLYLLNCPQYVIAYLGALKAGARVTPISPVYTSQEVRHQLEDSEARTVVCEDILYENVAKCGITPEHVILTHISDYLPALKKMFGRSSLGKAYSGMQVPTAEEIKQRGLLLFMDLIKKTPARPPTGGHRPATATSPRCPTPGGRPGCPRRPS